MTFEAHFTLDLNHPILANHRVLGRHLLPGLAYIDLVYQLFRDHSLGCNELELRQVAIHQPLVVTAGSGVAVQVRCIPEGDDAWAVSIEGTAEGLFATAEMHRVPSAPFSHCVDRHSLVLPRSRSVAEVYRECLGHGLEHSGCMKGQGWVHEAEGGLWVEIEVDATARAQAEDSLFYPALIDCAALCSGDLLECAADGSLRLYLPLCYESFRATEALQAGCLAHIRESSRNRRNELRSFDVEFFSADGRQVAELRNFTVKLVRGERRGDVAPAAAASLAASRPARERADVAQVDAVEAATDFLRQLVAQKVDVAADGLRDDAGYYELGLSSAHLLEMVKAVSERLGRRIPPTLFFEHTTIGQLAEHLGQRHPTAFAAQGCVADTPPGDAAPAAAQSCSTASCQHSDYGATTVSAADPRHDVAITGLAGRFPQAADVQAFWSNLCDGRDCITEVPPSRWDWQALESVRSASGRPLSRWGGFIDDVDAFDAAFFRISPREAELMDPQERLFLQTCWEAIEDAGYTPATLAAAKGPMGRRPVGVFAGLMHKDYSLIGAQAASAGAAFPLSLNCAQIANRVSYACNFNGPSLTVDTVCSSSLVAVHLALQSLRSGESEVALAGGVNLSLHPGKYMSYGLMDMHATDGRCRSFGEGGDGYVSAEGVGAVLLKPLSKALQDNDHIYAVIRGSSVNHVGAVGGFTVPSPVLQADMVLQCIEDAGVDPRTIGYVEAHGTGTSLGDPIEIQGLVTAFTHHTPDCGFCAIGSVKSNIGHAESAAGICGLIKVALQLKHRTLVPTLHSQATNPYIDLENSPFRLQHTLQTWDAPASGAPRRAALSSFGATGTNAHLILEEAPVAAQTPADAERNTVLRRPALLVLSARNEERLRAHARRLRQALDEAGRTGSGLSDIAYTLQVGREAMDERLAFVAHGIDDALRALDALLDGASAQSHLYTRGNARRKTTVAGIANLIEQGQWRSVADAWVQGAEVPWQTLHEGTTPRRVALPTYPFSQERYWVPQPAVQRSGSASVPAAWGVSAAAVPRAERVSTAAPAAEEGMSIGLYEELWVPAKRGAAVARTTGTLVCFLSDASLRRDFEARIAHTAAADRIVFVRQDDCFQALSSSEYVLDAGNAQDFKSLFDTVGRQFGPIAGVCYLWPLEGAAQVREYVPLLHLLQGLAEANAPRARVLLAGACADHLDRCHVDSWVGFQRSLRLLMPDVDLAVLIDEVAAGPEALIDDAVAEYLAGSTAVRYRNRQRQVCRVVAREALTPQADRLRRCGTYLITGGCGALGLRFATHLARTRAARLVLTGRSPMSAEVQHQIDRLRALGGDALYLPADTRDFAGMQAMWKEAEARFGAIHGVIHAAGVLEDANLLEKTAAQFEAVLAPKVEGSLVIDRLAAGKGVDFVCWFSSSSAVLGDFGSCDYAVGNRFQMAFGRGDDCGKDGEPHAPSWVINWPLWQDGGMGLRDAASTQMYLRSSGQRTLHTDEGLALFERLLAASPACRLVMAGQPERVQRFLGVQPVAGAPGTSAQAPAAPTAPRVSAQVANDANRAPHVEKALVEFLAPVLKVQPERVDVESNFADLGFDSIMLGEYARVLSEHYRLNLSPSVFFSHSSVRMLAQHLLDKFPEAVTTAAVDIDAKAFTVAPAWPAVAVPMLEPAPSSETLAAAVPASVTEAIAIIGMSGRFPGARNVDELWQILRNGRDVVGELPPERLRWHRQAAGDAGDASATWKWSGLVPGVDEFDPLFFEISPREAELMDPRQRLLLQEAWNALEDAAYGPVQLKAQRIGIFVGVEQGDYPLLVGNQGSITANHDGILAARLAYFLDLHGPVMALNTACSSGLTALHQACASLRSGEADAAIAAGASLLLTGQIYKWTGDAGMLSADGKCFTFDARANGMVPAEAVVAVVLKRLSQAQRDGDPIHAVVVGSGVNYDGKSNGMTAPSGASQTALLKAVYDHYRVRPEELGHMVAHGTGTPLGDAVEVNALDDAFRAYTAKARFCALTSTKTNLGHTLAASGLVSLVGLVQGLRHGIIPASLHCKSENDAIDWSTSPFVVNRAARPWPAVPGRERYGAVSAFGMSGTNAHVVVRSHRAFEAVDPASPDGYMLVLSGKTDRALRARIEQVRNWMATEEGKATPLVSISYTLLAGRHTFQHRCALVVRGHDEAQQLLGQALQGSKSAQVFMGYVARDFIGHAALHAYVSDLSAGRLSSGAGSIGHWEALVLLADFFCQGYAPNWGGVLGAKRPGRIHLPTYLFEPERHWVGSGRDESVSPLPAASFDMAFFDELLDGVAQGSLSVDSALRQAHTRIQDTTRFGLTPIPRTL